MTFGANYEYTKYILDNNVLILYSSMSRPTRKLEHLKKLSVGFNSEILKSIFILSVVFIQINSEILYIGKSLNYDVIKQFFLKNDVMCL